MKILGFLLATLLLASQALAHPLKYCVTLDSRTNQTSSVTGNIVEFKPQNIRALSLISTSNYDSGTTSTLDLKVQTCRTAAGGGCIDFASFTQCTTTACGGGDGVEVIDANMDTVNFFKYLRVVSTLAGTSPQYDYTVEACFDGTN